MSSMSTLNIFAFCFTLAAYHLFRSSEMEETRIESNTDNSDRAREIFERVNDHICSAENRDFLWQRFEPSRVTSGTDSPSHGKDEQCVQQHSISSVVFRWIETENRKQWELENVWDNVHISQSDHIEQEAKYKWLPMNYLRPKDVHAVMAENMNIILLRNIIDWSHPDGNVWSHQIVYSGNFDRILELFDDNSDTTNFIEIMEERFDLHPHLREQYIVRRGSHPIAAAVATVDSSPTVIISNDGEGDRSLCVVCQDLLSSGEEKKEFLCNRNHVFHENCLLKWFYGQFTCPLCREINFSAKMPQSLIVNPTYFMGQ